MTVDARLESLGNQHSVLESRIAEELRRPLADEQRVQTLKRRKLAIKDEISLLEAKRRMS